MDPKAYLEERCKSKCVKPWIGYMVFISSYTIKLELLSSVYFDEIHNFVENMHTYIIHITI